MKLFQITAFVAAWSLLLVTQSSCKNPTGGNATNPSPVLATTPGSVAILSPKPVAGASDKRGESLVVPSDAVVSSNAVASSNVPVSSGTKTNAYAVIIKAGGYVKQPGPDSLSSATTEPYNTHLFADVLAHHLRELSVQTQVVSWVDCENLSCLHVPHAPSTATIVVFAGVTHDGKLPKELETLVPLLGKTSPKPSVVSVMTSCNKVPGTKGFISVLAAAGLATIPGVSPQADSALPLTDVEMHNMLKAFAKRLVDRT